YISQWLILCLHFFFQAEDGIRDFHVTGVQTCALPISLAAWILINIGVYTSESKQKSMDVLDLLTGSTLLGFFTDPEVIIIGPAWTLLVQIFFYAYVAATIPLLRRQAWIQIGRAHV